jgi:hypothetical protein
MTTPFGTAARASARAIWAIEAGNTPMAGLSFFDDTPLMGQCISPV